LAHADWGLGMIFLATDTAAHLAKICGLFSSDHAGERAAAAQKADQMVRGFGLTWRQLLSPQPVSDNERMVEFSLRFPEYCSEREWEFLHGVAGKQKLSEKQRIWLEQIFHRARIRSKAAA